MWMQPGMMPASDSIISAVFSMPHTAETGFKPQLAFCNIYFRVSKKSCRMLVAATGKVKRMILSVSTAVYQSGCPESRFRTLLCLTLLLKVSRSHRSRDSARHWPHCQTQICPVTSCQWIKLNSNSFNKNQTVLNHCAPLAALCLSIWVVLLL